MVKLLMMTYTVSGNFRDEICVDSTGCMVMQSVKIYQARFRPIFGGLHSRFTPFVPETPPVSFRFVVLTTNI